MTESDVAIQIKAILDAVIVTAPFTAVVKQSFNPDFLGAPLDAMVFFTKIAEHRWGHQGTKDTYNAGNDNFDTVARWWVRATYQINALMNQDVTNVASLSAGDVVGFCAGTLQTAETRKTFFDAGIGIDRIMGLRFLGAPDDSDRYNMNVSFDFVLTYEQTLLSTTPKAAIVTDFQRV